MVPRAFGEAPFFPLTMILLLSSALCFRASVNAEENDVERTCPHWAVFELTNVTRNATGFLLSLGSDFFFPIEIVWQKFGKSHGCMCDVAPCASLCAPTIDPNKTEFFNSDDFPEFPLVYTTNLTLDDDGNSGRFVIFPWKPCSEFYALTPKLYPDDEWYLLGNGSLFLPRKSGSNALLGWRQYCFSQSWNETIVIPQVCFPTVQPDPYRTASYIGGLVSVPFIILTIIVYSVLPELKSIHRNTFRCYLGCLLVTYIAFAVNRIPARDEHIGTTCLVSGFIIYFSFLASFFWLNVMCFDMWWKFRGYGSDRLTRKLHDRKKFILYSIYAWGGPALLTVVCISLEFTSGIPESVIKPGFTEQSCWFSTKTAAAWFFYGPIGVTIFCNVCLFASISRMLFRHKRNTQRQLSCTDSQRHNDNRLLFGLYLKLFVIMGISWSMEVISGLWNEPKYVWYFTDMINALQGILIFVIFVCKRKIWHSLVRRFKSSPRFGDNRCTDIRRSVESRATISSVAAYSSRFTNGSVTVDVRQSASAEASISQPQ